MSNDHLLPLKDIIVLDRQRTDLGNIQELADSIKELGIIEPIVVNQYNRLIAGGRRLAAAALLGLEVVPIHRKETHDEEHLTCMELEENVRRKEMTWQERALSIYKIHTLKQNSAAKDREVWGMRQTGELLGISSCKVQYNSDIARALKSRPKDDPFHKCTTYTEALQYLMREQEMELMRLKLAKSAGLAPPAGPSVDLPDEPPSQETLSAADVDHSIDNLEVRKDRIRQESENRYYLSRWCRQGDCLELLPEVIGEGGAYYIITDPPYGIDVSNMAQSGTHSMSNIDEIEEEHSVEGNEELFRKMFPVFYNILKPDGLVALWCDIMQWHNLYDAATTAGFKVQRWPIVWAKTHTCKNGSPQYNTTKNMEFVMVCRKGNMTLPKPVPTSVVIAGNDALREELGGHPFCKPYMVWEYLIRNLTMEGSFIVDPFAGRGSCVITALRMGRHVYAFEKDPNHYLYLQDAMQKHYLSINPNAVFV